MKNALSGLERALFWMLVFGAFAAASAGLAARAVDRAGGAYEDQRQRYVMVRVIAPDSPAGLATAEAALDASPMVAAAARLSPARAADILRIWGQAPMRPEEMPPLRLIEVELAPGAADIDAGELEALLAGAGVTAEAIAAPTGASGGGLAQRISAAATWGAVAFGLVMALIVSLSARAIAARRREFVVAMTDLGATPNQAAGRIAEEAALVGLYAGLMGALLAALVVTGLLFALIPGLTLTDMIGLILPLDIVPLAATPLGAAIAAWAGARAAAGLFYAQAARIA